MQKEFLLWIAAGKITHEDFPIIFTTDLAIAHGITKTLEKRKRTFSSTAVTAVAHDRVHSAIGPQAVNHAEIAERDSFVACGACMQRIINFGSIGVSPWISLSGIALVSVCSRRNVKSRERIAWALHNWCP